MADEQYAWLDDFDIKDTSGSASTSQYIELYAPNGDLVSRHSKESEAIQASVRHAIAQGYPPGKYKYEFRTPNKLLTITLLEADVVAKGYGVLAPDQSGDTTPPTEPQSLSGSALSATDVLLTWGASVDDVGVVAYQVYRDGAPVDINVPVPSFTDTGLAPSTQYSYEVAASDAAGNQSSRAGPVLVSTDPNSAPVWSLGDQSYDVGEAVTISLDNFCSDADGDTLTYSLASGSLPSGLSLSGTRNQTLSGTADTAEVAAFTLTADDGIVTSDNALTFTVSEPDTTAPAVPTGLTSTATSTNSIDLDWADNSEQDFASYTLYRSFDDASYGVLVSGLVSSNYIDSGLNAGVTHYYKVSATDTSGNESAQSGAYSVATDAFNPASWDTIPPQSVDDTYPNTIVGLKATYLTNGETSIVTVHDRPDAGNDLVSSGVVSYDDSTDTLTVVSDPAGKEVFLRATEDPAAAYWAQRSTANGVLLAENFSSYTDVSDLLANSRAFFSSAQQRPVELSTDSTYVTSGKAVLMVRQPADGTNACNHSLWLSGSTQQSYSRIYVQVVWHSENDELDWPHADAGGGVTDSMKFFILDYFNGTAPVQTNEIVIDNEFGTGFINGYFKGPGQGLTHWWESRTTPCPGSPDFAWQPAIDRGTPASPSTCGEYMQRYGPTNYGVARPAAGSRLSTQGGLPDPDALIGGERFWPDDKTVVEVFADYDTSTIQIWAAKYGQSPTLIVDYQGTASFNSTSNHWDHIMLLNYNSDGIPEGSRPVGRRAYCEVISSTQPINFPGGFSPPSNLG